MGTHRGNRIRQGIVVLVLLGVGLLNLIPGIGLIAPGRLADLYGVAGLGGNEVVLLRHRALLLGLLGVFMIMAVAVPAWRLAALGAGLISNLVFVLLVLPAEVTPAVDRVAWIDLIALPFLVLALLVEIVQARTRRVKGRRGT